MPGHKALGWAPVVITPPAMIVLLYSGYAGAIRVVVQQAEPLGIQAVGVPNAVVVALGKAQQFEVVRGGGRRGGSVVEIGPRHCDSSRRCGEAEVGVLARSGNGQDRSAPLLLDLEDDIRVIREQSKVRNRLRPGGAIGLGEIRRIDQGSSPRDRADS